MPTIRKSADLRNAYGEISEFCHKYREPVFITKNGTGDLAVMSIETYEELTGKRKLYNLFAVGFNTPQLAAVKLWQRLEFMVVNPTRTKNFLYKKKYPAALPRGFFIGRWYK